MRAAVSINQALTISFNQVFFFFFLQCLHDPGSPIDLSHNKIDAVADTEGHTKFRDFSFHSSFHPELETLLIKLDSRRCLFRMCCQSIQIHTGKNMKIFHLHSWKGQNQWGAHYFLKLPHIEVISSVRNDDHKSIPAPSCVLELSTCHEDRALTCIHRCWFHSGAQRSQRDTGNGIDRPRRCISRYFGTGQICTRRCRRRTAVLDDDA